MNLNRSYSNPARLCLSQVEELKGDISKLLAGPSNLEVRADGRIFIKSLNKYYTGGGNIKVDLLDENDLPRGGPPWVPLRGPLGDFIIPLLPFLSVPSTRAYLQVRLAKDFVIPQSSHICG